MERLGVHTSPFRQHPGLRHQKPSSPPKATSVAAPNIAPRDAALSDLDYRDGYFEVALPIEDVLGRDLLAAVEGVVRIGPRSNPQGVAEMNFEGGRVIARFRIAADEEPRLITMFPIGRRQ